MDVDVGNVQAEACRNNSLVVKACRMQKIHSRMLKIIQVYRVVHVIIGVALIGADDYFRRVFHAFIMTKRAVFGESSFAHICKIRYDRSMKKNTLIAGQCAVLFAALCMALLSSCGRIKDSAQDKKEKNERSAYQSLYEELHQEERLRNEALARYVRNASVHEKVCQMFIENVEGDTTFVPVEKKFIPGGYLFFSYNLADSARGIMRFTDSIRDWCYKNGEIPPFLAIDQEGGDVNRLRAVAGPLPSARRVADTMTLDAAYRLYTAQARQMRALGFHLNLAPVVEELTPGNEQFLEGRSFGNYMKVRTFGTACINAYENRGVGAVIKHFPGNTNADPHTGLPEITLSSERLEESIKSFSQVLRANPSGTLISHARTTAVDPGVPACFSSVWITERLCGSMGYDGIVFSDDVFMGALNANGYPPEEAAVRAVQAGVNCIMISEKRFSKPAAVLIERAKDDAAFAALVDASFEKIIAFKLRCGILRYERGADGGYEIVPSPTVQSVDARLKEFNEAKKQNVDLCVTYF